MRIAGFILSSLILISTSISPAQTATSNQDLYKCLNLATHRILPAFKSPDHYGRMLIVTPKNIVSFQCPFPDIPASTPMFSQETHPVYFSKQNTGLDKEASFVCSRTTFKGHKGTYWDGEYVDTKSKTQAISGLENTSEAHQFVIESSLAMLRNDVFTRHSAENEKISNEAFHACRNVPEFTAFIDKHRSHFVTQCANCKVSRELTDGLSGQPGDGTH